MEPYLAITAHYITSTKEQLNDWKLESRVIGFTGFSGRHTGANEASFVLRVVDRYNLRNKVSLLVFLSEFDDPFI